MPEVWTRSAKVYQRLWKRRGQVFCDGCGKVIQDDHYWKWQVMWIGDRNVWLERTGSTHLNGSCVGFFLLGLLESVRNLSDNDALHAEESQEAQ